MKKLFTLLTLLVAIVTGAWAQTTATFESDNLNITSSSKTVNGVTLSNNGTDWSYQNGLYAGGGGKTFNLSVANGTISQILITMSGTSNRFTNTNITNCTSCTRDGSVYTLVINPATSTVAVKNNGGGVTVTKIEVTYTLSGPQDPSFTVPSEIVVGETGTITGPSGLNFTATVKSGSEYVSVDGATISANAIGNAVITVSSEAVADTWNAFTQNYNVTVVDEPVTPQPVAGGEKTITFNGQNEGDTDYFTWNSAKHSFNSKFTGATYDGITFTSGLKMEGATQIGFTNTLPATVTIVQSTWSDKTIKFDGTELVVNDATAGTGCRVYTVSDVAAGTHSITRGSGESGLFLVKVVESAPATEKFTVTFNAGSNGICATASLTEATPGAGVELPAVTANEGYQFNGWFTAATEGTKVGNAGDIYKPSADVEIFAQYLQPSAPTSVTISGAPTAAVVLNQVVKLTATVEGAVPDATVDWLDESDNVLASATTTYTVPTTDLGSVKVKARATNESGSVSSELVTINVINPNKTIEANEYFISVGEQVYPDEKITGTDIALTFVNGKAGESFTAGVSDNMISGENSNYVASISGSQSNNGWKAKFEPTADGVLKVGVVINNKKTFSITPAANVTSFSYKGKNNADPQVAVGETVEGNSLTTGDETTDKIYVEVTLNVEANKEYSFSVAGSKMGFYGFTFTPTVPVTITSAGAASFSSTEALDFSAVEGITAYKATAKSDSYVHLDEVAQVPAGAGVIVKGAEGIYNVPVATGDVAELEGNLLVGTAEAEYTVGDDYGKVFKYVKRTSDNVVGFQKAKADWTCQVGHAYLKFSGTQARDFIGIFGEEEVVTGIDAIENGTIDNDAPAYNLAGQKVGKGYKGIVIINGKKVVK